MPTQRPHYHWQPTGRIRIRTGWFGFLVVEEEQDRKRSFVMMGERYDEITDDDGWERRWRRARRNVYLPRLAEAATHP